MDRNRERLLGLKIQRELLLRKLAKFMKKDEKIKELKQQLEEQKKQSDSAMKKKDLTIDPPEIKPVTIFHVNNQPASQ